MTSILRTSSGLEAEADYWARLRADLAGRPVTEADREAERRRILDADTIAATRDEQRRLAHAAAHRKHTDDTTPTTEELTMSTSTAYTIKAKGRRRGPAEGFESKAAARRFAKDEGITGFTVEEVVVSKATAKKTTPPKKSAIHTKAAGAAKKSGAHVNPTTGRVTRMKCPDCGRWVPRPDMMRVERDGRSVTVCAEPCVVR